MIYVGDGTTDIPCMRLVKNSGGHSIAVYNPEIRNARRELNGLIRDNRVSHVCPADYSEGSEMDTLVKTIIDKIEAKLSGISSITALLNAGKTPEEILTDILGEFGLEILSKMPVQFHCDCDRSRVEKAIISIGKKEIQDMINEGREIEVNCQFCNKHYEFSVDELKKLYEKAKK